MSPSIEPVARRLLGKPTHSTKTELRYGSKGSLSIRPRTNQWYDFERGDGGGVLDLVIRERGGTRAEAMEWLIDEGLVESNGEFPHKPDRPDKTPEQRRAEALAIWKPAGPIENSPGEAYFAGRGILLGQLPPCIRYHRRLHAVIALVQAPDGSFSGIQRIYLRTDARGTWRADRDKQSKGIIKHSAVRLTPAAENIQLAESVEDGLALLQLTGRPTWAVPGAGFMASFEPPPEVREMVLAPDHDHAGLKAIENARHNLHGVTLRQLLPPPGMDWCQVLEDYDERLAIQQEPEPARSWVEEFCDG